MNNEEAKTMIIVIKNSNMLNVEWLRSWKRQSLIGDHDGK